jgi:hypothetical protein
MIRRDDDIDVVEDIALPEALNEEADVGIDGSKRISYFRGIGTVPVSGAIGFAEVQRDETGPLVRRQVEPVENLADAFLAWNPAVVLTPVPWADVLDGSFRAGPEIGGRDLPLFLCGDPQRLALPPPRIYNRVLIRKAESAVDIGIIDIVRNDTVILGV